MKPLLAILQLALCFATASLASAACPTEDWKPYRGKCYYASTFEISGWPVNDVCDFGFNGSKAASVHDLDVNTFLAYDLMEGRSTWLGLYRRQNDTSFTWRDGTPVDWTYFDEPPQGTDEVCVSINYVQQTTVGLLALRSATAFYLRNRRHLVAQLDPEVADPPLSRPESRLYDRFPSTQRYVPHSRQATVMRSCIPHARLTAMRKRCS